MLRKASEEDKSSGEEIDKIAKEYLCGTLTLSTYLKDHKIEGASRKINKEYGEDLF